VGKLPLRIAADGKIDSGRPNADDARPPLKMNLLFYGKQRLGR